MMTVYVDDMAAPYRGMIMCHMIADTRQELFAMATALNLAHKWCQYPGTWKEHFDISKGYREHAVRLGAVQITKRELARKVNARYTAQLQRAEALRSN